jgi:hypothetical protein
MAYHEPGQRAVKLLAFFTGRLLRDPDAERRRQLIGERAATLQLYSTSTRRVTGTPKNAPGLRSTPRAHDHGGTRDRSEH